LRLGIPDHEVDVGSKSDETLRVMSRGGGR